MRKRKFDRITPTLGDDLHWLPVPERIVFKLCLIIFKCHHQTAPEYLQELWVPVTASTSRRHLRSVACGDLQVLACRTSTFGPHSFAACAPKLRNSLPLSLRDPTLTPTSFCSRLKTHLFSDCLGCKNSRVINFLIHTYSALIAVIRNNEKAGTAPSEIMSEPRTSRLRSVT